MKMRAVNKSHLTTHKSIAKLNESNFDKIKGDSAYAFVFKGNESVGLRFSLKLGFIGFFTVICLAFKVGKLFSSGNE